ncbi:MAG: molybdopterin cofactor-binding domain-containing protein [Bryobacteraceae bacterium]
MKRRHRLESPGAGWLLTCFARHLSGQRHGESVEARIHLGDEGIFTVLSGKVEEGQGPRTELPMVAAQTLGVMLERIRVILCDTARTPDGGITAGSRTTPIRWNSGSRISATSASALSSPPLRRNPAGSRGAPPGASPTAASGLPAERRKTPWSPPAWRRRSIRRSEPSA